MKTYILCQKNLESVYGGTDTLVMIDGRLNNENKKIAALKHIKRLENIKPSLKNEAYYLCLFELSRYDAQTGKYFYSNPIKL
jgi:ATP phosphoribosyltransferase regulatory subunit HisZ